MDSEPSTIDSVTSCYNRLPSGYISEHEAPVICSVNQKGYTHLKTTHMKTKIIIAGIIVAIVSAFAVTRAKAQQPEQPAIKIVPAAQKDMIKIIYAYHTNQSVKVNFSTSEGLIKSDEIRGKDFDGGFYKKYNLQNINDNTVWVEVTSPELSATFKLKSMNGKWIAELEKTTYNYPSVALN